MLDVALPSILIIKLYNPKSYFFNKTINKFTKKNGILFIPITIITKKSFEIVEKANNLLKNII